ncbi:E3 SUMO-protein ligase ZNF451 isoform X3 [Narcine bancroftii]|uniref:E3 SUMO-protein ligase ZNF451 isoform X3 n=1 Tax=Narcine bancroftii TaxID=1343680 RepID=UPI0038310671
MSSSDALISAGNSESEDEVIFVSVCIIEEPLRPVLECIDLSNEDDNEGNISRHDQKPKDHIDRQKARVLSTLDRLARHVEVEKQLKEEKCKAFQKEKPKTTGRKEGKTPEEKGEGLTCTKKQGPAVQRGAHSLSQVCSVVDIGDANCISQKMVDSQHAHGIQELEFLRGHTANEEARRCIDSWLQVPGPKPGVVSFGRGPVKRRVNASVKSDPIACPIMNCNRKFDNRHLLLGHLKRFDHSPCDPAITLHGSPSTSYICIACCEQFVNLQKYEDHLALKVSSEKSEGHRPDLEPQICQCFGCPSCYLLFNLRDECLQHMIKSSHFQQRYKLSDEQGTPSPLPFPNYAKKLLISLCQEVPFQVKCISCHQMLCTHVELTAHFRTQCRRAGPVALSAKDVGQVAAIFKVRGRCLDCNRLFVDDNQVVQHTQQTMHSICWIGTMDKAIVEFCIFNKKNKVPSDLHMTLDQSRARRNSPFKRALSEMSSDTKELSAPISLKRSRRDCNSVQLKEERPESGSSPPNLLWFCECRQQFDTEKAVEKHIMSANGIHHKCLVCGILTVDMGIIGLHMSRRHGGAHLNHYHFWCKRCQAEMLRRDDLMAHIVECHRGHAYYYEEEVDKDEPMDFEPTPIKLEAQSTDLDEDGKSVKVDPEASELGTTRARGLWQCRLCEEMFESEEGVMQHCSCLSNHQFYKFSCGFCKKRFHRVETLYRHSRDQHNSELNVKYFCGLCDEMEFNLEDEFHDHYKAFHGTDYIFVEHRDATTDKVTEMEVSDCQLWLSCGCQQHYSSKQQRAEESRRCMRSLFCQGNLWFCCASCTVTAQSKEDIQVHLAECHKVKGASTVVKCICSKSFSSCEAAQMHYHSKHCTFLQPASSSAADDASIPHTEIQCHDAKKTMQDYHAGASTSGESSTACQVDEEATFQEDIELPDLDLLRTMAHLVFIDLDNWAGFFNHLPGQLNQGTFFWGFQGGKSHWKTPENCPVFNYLVNTGCFFLHPRCSARKDAADFAICMHAGRMDEQLPKHIPFTVLSGDKGFEELKNQLKKTMRPGHVLNPHHMEGELMCALLNSISDIGKDDEDEALQETLTLSLTKQDIANEGT